MNVVINAEKEVIHAVAGHAEEAHMAGCRFLSRYCKAMVDIPRDIVITTTGGYPLDQNVY